MDAHAAACRQVAGRFLRPWLRHYVAAKLRSDPVFPAVYAELRDSDEPLLDIGCGVGLLPFYLRARGFAPPIIGLDTDTRKLEHARRAVAPGEAIEFRESDVRQPWAPFRGNVALLDVVHYLSPAAQQELLARLAGCVAPGAALLLRDAPRDGSARFWMTYAGEIFAQAISWNVGVPLHFATRESIQAPFRAAEFTRAEQPAGAGTPFNNRLFVFRRRPSATAPDAG